ncbi:lambda exonuclease family protein [Terrabacter sp. C0L_2]|uniref:lambda exonuclease family protein n=1 Tax=Terrabacter sp. C0L_2 TaxID=3108389 RepID=UPI002ED577AA|nr:lambda exonuclease family protein [Terrabacter sp. C0L_2]
MTLNILTDLEQGSDEWLDARRGIVTASTVGKLLTPTGRVASNDFSRALTLELAAERIIGASEYVFVNADMERGNEVEPLARDLYASHYDRPVTQVGFMTEDKWGFTIGFSPDGLVGDDGLIEVKGPRAKKHLRTIVEDQVPAEHMAQIQCGLLVSGRAWCDFITYFGGMPMYPIRVHADPKWQEAIVVAVTMFELAVTEITNTYKARTAGLPMTDPLPTYEEITF